MRASLGFLRLRRLGPRCALQLALVAASMTTARMAHAGEADERPPLPEPIFTESVTDLDAREGQELELEANFGRFHARRGGASRALTSLEVEYRATSWFGFLVEPGLDRTRDVGDADPRWRGGVAVAGAFGLFHDFARDLHLQFEVAGRVPATDEAGAIGDSALPFDTELRGGARVGRFTIRPGVGVEAGGHVEHAPLRGSLAVLTPFTDDARFGFFGVEAEVDGARTSPVVLAANFISDVTPFGAPFRFGIAIPWVVAADDTRPSLGLYVRIFYVSDREAEYGADR